MERQVSVGPDRPVKEGHLWRWITFFRKISSWTEVSHLCFDEISGNFSIMESTHCYKSVLLNIICFSLRLFEYIRLRLSLKYKSYGVSLGL